MKHKIQNFSFYFDKTKTMIEIPSKAYIDSLYDENKHF